MASNPATSIFIGATFLARENLAMGCDIETIAQRKNGDTWETIEGAHPFDWRSYRMFGFLADVRNYSDVPPISKPRGYPADFVDLDDRMSYLFASTYHSQSWLSVEELLAFDYDAPVENRRVTVQTGPNRWDHGATAESGGGEMTTWREFLGPDFFDDLAKLKADGAERIVFAFDS